jgi:hypothetical protein
MVYEVESKKYLDGYEMDWCHFVLLKKKQPKKKGTRFGGFLLSFSSISPLYFKSGFERFCG